MNLHRCLALAAAALVSLTGCGAPSQPLAAPAAAPLVERVHPYALDQGGIFANAYLIESVDGVVAVDATLTVSNARALRARLDALHRPLLAVLLTHGHPDHYNGLTELTAGLSVPIIATAGVDRVIREWDARKEAQWKPMFKDEWPATRTFPDRIAADGETLTFGGVRFTAHDLGPGESHHDTYWVAEADGTQVAFIGDLAFHDEHAYLSDGHSTAWLANLAAAATALSAAVRLYPGHGSPGGLELLTQQRAYLDHYRTTVRTLAAGRPTLTDAEKSQLTDAMTAYLPAGKLTFLIPLGADPVAAELATP